METRRIGPVKERRMQGLGLGIPRPGIRRVSSWRRRAQEPRVAGFGDCTDRFLAVHGKDLDRGLDSAEAAMEDEGERHLVDEGVVGRSMARVHQTRILTKGRVPGR